MLTDPPGGNYLEELLVAIRGAGQRTISAREYLGSAGQATSPAWKWQLLSAAGREHAGALAHLDEADERLQRLSGQSGLPPPLDVLPSRIKAMRDELAIAEGDIQRALAESLGCSVGSA